MIEKQASRMDATKWLVVVLAAVIVLLLALLSQQQASPKAGPAPAPAPSPSATSPATPTADPSAEAARREFLLSLPRREASDPLAMGAVDAPVVLTEWADYRCPFCSVWAEETLPHLQPILHEP